MINQVNKQVVALANPNSNTTTMRVLEFTRMNPPKFHGSKVDKDPQDLIYEIEKIIQIMGIISVENRICQHSI